jgi:PAS domain S-box-containing protein
MSESAFYKVTGSWTTNVENLIQLAESIPYFVFILDNAGQPIYSNRLFCRYAGVTEPLLGETWFDLCHPDETQLVRDGLATRIAAGKPFETEFRVRREDGAFRWHVVSAVPLKDLSGQIYGWLGTSTDALQQVQVRERVFRTVFDNTFQFIALLEKDGKVIEANKSVLKFIDRRLQDVKGKYAWETAWFAHSPTARETVKQAVETAAQGQFVRAELQTSNANGNIFYFDFSVKPIFDESGEVTYLIPEARDITEQKIAQEKLRLSERHFRTIYDNASDLILSMSISGALIYANPTFESLLGYQIGDGHLINFFDIVEQQSLATTKSAFDRLCDDRYAKLDISLIGKSGQLHEFEGQLSRDHYEDINLVTAIFRDVSTEREMARRVGEFYSSVSHELRTPLTSIRASLGLIEGGLAGEIPDKTAKLVHIARIESDRLVRMVNDILDIKKVESGKLELKYEDLCPKDLVDRTIETLRGMALELNVHLSVENKNVPTSFAGDRDRLTQVLTNLISNALKFSPPEATVVVSTASCGGMVRFSVEDKGPGISKEDSGKLFGLFEQFSNNSSRTIKGSGLGLAISKSLVELHHGKIGYRTELGKGSTFWFEVPITRS